MRGRAASVAALVALVALAGTCSVSRATFAAEDDEVRPTGMRAGIQSGFAVPIGQTFTGSGALGETVRGLIPIRADVGARIADHFYVGGLFEYGVVLPNACVEGMQCSGTRIRLGVAAAYHFLPARVVDPWIGVAIAYETISMSRATSSSTIDVSASAIDLPSLELGIDVRPTAWLRVGPVFSGAMGRYTSLTLNETTTRDFDPAWHAWVTAGFRTMVDF